MLVRPTVLTTAAVAALVLAACGRVSSDAAQAPVPAPVAGDCPDVVTQTLGAVEAGLVAREDVTDLGAVLAGEVAAPSGGERATLFDSTGLAIQDLAVSISALEALR